MAIKEKAVGYFTGLKSLLARNPILIILIYIFERYGMNMTRGFRTLVGSSTLGVGPEIIGFAVSIYTIVGMIMRTPSGLITDNLRSKLKQVLVVCFMLKIVVWIGFASVNSVGMYYFVLAADGFLWSVIGTMLPAMLAICVDRRVLGTAAALFMGVPNTVCASGRSVGISLFNNYGIKTTILVCAVTAILAAVCTMLLDTKNLTTAGSEEVQSAPKPGKKKRGFSWALVPFCIAAAMPIVQYNAYQNFFQLHAEAEGITYLAADAIGGTIFGVLNIAIGPICDIVNPVFFLLLSLAGQTIAPFIWGTTTADSMITISLLIFYCTRWYGTVFKVVGQKTISKADMGKLSGTMFMMNDLFTALCTSVVGVAAGAFGYMGCFKALTVWGIGSIVLYLVVEMTSLKKMRAQRAAEEQAAVAARGTPDK